MWPPLLLWLFLIFSQMGSIRRCSSTPSYPLAPALYVLGDSLVDNGNNNWLPTVARANYLPYGLNFAAGVTGRFTNGRTSADFIAEYLGLPYPPPYASRLGHGLALDVRLSGSVSLTGYNYASASSGILPETGSHFGKCFSLDEQIEMFESTVHSQAATFKDPTRLSLHLAKSIFVLSVGNNDYINNYFDPLYVETKGYNPLQFAQLLIGALSQKLQRMYDLGARKVMVPEIGPIGCIPTIARRLKLGLTHNMQCDNDANRIVSIFNKQLAFMLTSLSSTLQGSHFILGHVYSITYDAVLNPTKFGLNDSRNPCCSTWLNGSLLCIPEVPACGSPNKHYFWDGYHPTESVFSFLAAQCIHGSSVCLPINLKHLVQL